MDGNQSSERDDQDPGNKRRTTSYYPGTRRRYQRQCDFDLLPWKGTKR